MRITVFWDDALCCLVVIALMMEAVSTSETSMNFYETARRNIPEDNHLQQKISLTIGIYRKYSVIMAFVVLKIYGTSSVSS
jgi:hypothetical protein